MKISQFRPSPTLYIEFLDDTYSGGDILDILISIRDEILKIIIKYYSIHINGDH